MRTLIFAVVLAAVSGCGGDDGVGEEPNGRVPADYLPTDVDVSGLTEAQQICTLHRAVSYARMWECDPTGPADWAPLLTTPEEIFEQSLQTCTRPDQTMAVYTPPAPSEHVLRCLDFRAAAPCAKLAAAERDPTFAHCELVSPTW